MDFSLLPKALKMMWDITRDAALDLTGYGNGNSFGGKSLNDYVQQNASSQPPEPDPAAPTGITPQTGLMIVGGILLMLLLVRR